MTVLYPNPATRRIVEQALAQGKVVLWIVDNLRSLYSNPNITLGSTVGPMPAPLDGGAAMAPDFIVRGGTDGFAAAARSVGLYQGNGLSSETEDDAAARVLFANATFFRGTHYQA
jgi:hypothetical protein